MEQRTTWLTAPSLQNCSCSHPRYSNVQAMVHLTINDVVQASIILLLSLGILFANVLVIVVINSRRYSTRIHSQPRYLLTSLASNDLAIGLMVTPFGFLPALYKCWPYGELFCQIQALLRGALCQQSAIILICMAVDRYMCMMHPVAYYKRSSKKGCLAIISITWVTVLSLFAIIVLPKNGYYFNQTGLLACDPFFPKSSLRILNTCAFYFPTTMILMYCYGTAFHVNKPKLQKKCSETLKKASALTAIITSGSEIDKFGISEERSSVILSRTMAAMSLGFIVMVTPWTIQEVVIACTGYKVPSLIDFSNTWLALSHSFWNPFLYWLLNEEFREISKHFLFSAIVLKKEKIKTRDQCCNANGNMPLPPIILTRTDLAGLSEKYWGEILERTVSSSSLQAIKTGCTFSPPLPPPPPPPSLPYWKKKEIFAENLAQSTSQIILDKETDKNGKTALTNVIIEQIHF